MVLKYSLFPIFVHCHNKLDIYDPGTELSASIAFDSDTIRNR